jgi:transposase-like protein
MIGDPAPYSPFGYPRLFAGACRDSAVFERNFGTEERCTEWLRRNRWPRGFSCPRCGRGGRWIEERRGYLCSGCRKFCSLTAGTILQRTRKPLRKWFEALFLIVQRGVNARTLQREIGLTYKVAWLWGHKLRSLLGGHAMPAEAKDPREKNVRGRPRFKTFEAERARNGPRARRPEKGVPGPCGCSRLIARDWGWIEEPEPQSRFLWVPPPSVDLVDPPRRHVLAHWELLATYWGCATEKHLRSYLDELAFRLNWRFREAAESFLAVVPELVRAEPRPYDAIVARDEPAAETKPVSIFVGRERAC